MSSDSKLIPPGIANAIQSFANMIVMSKIDTGDRALNATVSTLCIAIFNSIFEKVQSLTVKDLYSLPTKIFTNPFSKPFNITWCCRYRKNLKVLPSNNVSPTVFDINEVPANVDTMKFDYSILFKDSRSVSLLTQWAIETYGWKMVVSDDSQNSKLALCRFQTGLELDSSNLPFSYSFKRIPVWRCLTTKEFVFMTVDRITTTNGCIVEYTFRLLCNNENTLNDMFIEVQKFSERFKLVKQISISNSRTRGGVSFPISQRKTFDSLFFEQKNELIKILTRFKNKKMYAEHLGQDNKLGILLYGPPGTGKTACVSAIANFLQRDIVDVDRSHMRSCELLSNFFRNTTDIILFDEFDCLLDIVSKKDIHNVNDINNDGKSDNEQSTLLLKLAEKETDSGKREKLMEQYSNSLIVPEKLSIGFLLSKFQGIESADGRCIIATTNHIDMIDDRLKRKGRFDIILHLDYATPTMIHDIINCYFQTDEHEQTELKRDYPESKLPMRVFSPAVIQDWAANSDSARETLEKIMVTYASMSAQHGCTN